VNAGPSASLTCIVAALPNVSVSLADTVNVTPSPEKLPPAGATVAAGTTSNCRPAS
jgi:hypothetical protein